MKRKVRKLRKKKKKIQTKNPNPVFSDITLQNIYVGEKSALISALPTHCKLSTETVAVSDIVIGEVIFGHVKVGHLT